MELNQERLDRVTALSAGEHPAPNGEFMACVMEAAAYVAGEPWSDFPKCTCPVIASFLRIWNDRLQSDEDRTRLLLPLVPKIIGATGSPALEERRSLMAADWLVRVHTPVLFRLAGLRDQAATLEALPEITSADQASTLRGSLEAIRADVFEAAPSPLIVAVGWAAGAGATAAAEVACNTAITAVAATAKSAGKAAGRIATAAVADAAVVAEDAGAALAAARDALRIALDEHADDTAAVDAADAAVEAADAAYWAEVDAAHAAENALKDTVTELQQSALVLVERMIALTDDDLAEAA